MKKILKKVNETGTLLVEAMAMLGLIAMVTPVLYKKASERTVELQDVNASSQLRALSTAIDGYLKDNFARITKGEKITNSNNDEADFSAFKDGGNEHGEAQVALSISHFSDYLPYGFLNDNGTPRETKLFTDAYNVIIKLESDIKDGKIMSQTLTGFVTATPKIPNEIGQVRASRIASMIGSNGGYVITEGGGQVAMGAQGIWSVPTSELGGGLVDNSFVVSSIQPISSQGLANEDVLHRKNEPDADDELNTMETDLFMGYTLGDTRNIRFVNQIIMHPDVSRMVGGDDGDNSQRVGDTPTATLESGGYKNTLDKALYIAKGGGAYMEGALQAINSRFTVKEGGTEDGIRYYGANTSTTDPVTGNTTTSRATKPTLKIDGKELVYGDPGSGKSRLTFNVSDRGGTLSVASDGVPANGTTPAQPGINVLRANQTEVQAGDNTLNIMKYGNNEWYTIIGKDASGNINPHEGGHTEYSWTNAAPDSGLVALEQRDKTGKYEVSINGSAFVKDTLLTGKVKTFNSDVSKLRAGVHFHRLNDATNDTDFYIVAKGQQVGPHDYNGSFIVGTNEVPMMTIADGETTDNTGRVIPGGVSISTADALEGARGIDIAAGDTGFMTYEKGNSTTAESFTVDEDAFPDDNTVRIGGLKGVFLSAYTGANNNIARDAPVSINDVMFRAWRRRDYNGGSYFDTIDQVVDSFNIFSTQINTTDEKKNSDKYWRAWWGRTLHGRMYVGDTAFIVGAKNGEPVFEAFPVAGGGSGPSAGTSWYPDYGASIKMTGGMAIYDYNYSHIASGSDNITNKEGHGRDAAIYANIGRFEIRSTIDDETRDIKKKDKLLVVDSHQNATYVPDNAESHGSVYIRKGAIALESNYDKSTGTDIPVGYDRNLTNDTIDRQYKNKKDAVGYIAADRFISHYKPSALLSDRTLPGYGEYVYNNGNAGGSKDAVYYDGYEINPAYTSVMHDIKLTTRGGARLSDILPDFINKGIYVVDTTFNPNTTKWVPGSKGIPGINPASGGEWGAAEAYAEKEVSPYAGFVPTPKCPPGYSKTITLTPSGWKMAEAGDIFNEDVIARTDYLNYKRGPSATTEDDREPLYFQKSTWLKAMVLPYYGKSDSGQFYSEGKNGDDFMGWGAIIGFIYPYAYWKDAVDNITINGKNTQEGDSDANDVYWNLFPVYYKQLEAYATVYCYFDRKSFSSYEEVYHDYDQLNALEQGDLSSYKKNEDGATEYIDRLNDPKLKYYDPW